MAAIKKRSLVDQVYEMLRGDIITLRRPLGSKLNVNALQDELGVSCTPIREAVNRLQQEGLVVYENNVGAHILDLDQHDITEIEQLAMTLHCAAIRLAMAHGDRAAIVTGLEKYLEEYRRARNVQSEVMAVNRFVGTFYAHCGNRRLDANMISIQGQQLLLRYIYADCLTERGSHAEDFEGMLEAARRGDAEEVCCLRCIQQMDRNTSSRWGRAGFWLSWFHIRRTLAKGTPSRGIKATLPWQRQAISSLRVEIPIPQETKVSRTGT